MNKIQSILNQSVNGSFAAVLVGVAGIGIPVYLLLDEDWSKLEFNIYSILLPVLYLAAVGSLMFFVAGVNGPNLTSAETDEKIASNWKRFQILLSPVFRVVAVLWIAWVLYLLWNLRHHF